MVNAPTLRAVVTKEADEMLKQEYPEDEEIIEKIKQIALEEGMLKIEVLR